MRFKTIQVGKNANKLIQTCESPESCLDDVLFEKEGKRKSTVLKIKATDGNLSLVQELYYFCLKNTLIDLDI